MGNETQPQKYLTIRSYLLVHPHAGLLPFIIFWNSFQRPKPITRLRLNFIVPPILYTIPCLRFFGTGRRAAHQIRISTAMNLRYHSFNPILHSTTIKRPDGLDYFGNRYSVNARRRIDNAVDRRP